MLETASGGTSQDTERIQESDRARGTHLLETASEGTTQDIERI